jgi:hypothetical protein
MRATIKNAPDENVIKKYIIKINLVWKEYKKWK